MASKTYELRLTSERTLRVMVGRMREYINLDHKEKGEIFEAVKWALISKDAFVSNEALTEDLYLTIWKWRE